MFISLIVFSTSSYALSTCGGKCNSENPDSGKYSYTATCVTFAEYQEHSTEPSLNYYCEGGNSQYYDGYSDVTYNFADCTGGDGWCLCAYEDTCSAGCDDGTGQCIADCPETCQSYGGYTSGYGLGNGGCNPFNYEPPSFSCVGTTSSIESLRVTSGETNCNVDNPYCICVGTKTCAADSPCYDTTGLCCTPSCVGKECGGDGCGGSCTDTCTGQEACIGNTCTCIPACAGKTCGDDGCGSTCGTCSDTEFCVNDNCLKNNGETCSDGAECVGGYCCDDSCASQACGPLTLSLSASNSYPSGGSSITLTATASEDPGQSLEIYIREYLGTQNQPIIKSCSTGDTCEKSVSEAAGVRKKYMATIGNGAGDYQVTTSTISVVWGTCEQVCSDWGYLGLSYTSSQCTTDAQSSNVCSADSTQRLKYTDTGHQTNNCAAGQECECLHTETCGASEQCGDTLCRSYPFANGISCSSGSDCSSGYCDGTSTCAVAPVECPDTASCDGICDDGCTHAEDPDCGTPTCSDGCQNGDETEIDCGGASCAECVDPCGSHCDYDYCDSGQGCDACGTGKGDCDNDDECSGSYRCCNNVGTNYGCESGVDVCTSASNCNSITSCSDGLDNGLEDGTDCGGPCLTAATEICNDGVDNDKDCRLDCSDSECNGNPVCGPCFNGVQNPGEYGIDCGGVCETGATEVCNDGVDNDADCLLDCNDGECFSDADCVGVEPNCIVYSASSQNDGAGTTLACPLNYVLVDHECSTTAWNHPSYGFQTGSCYLNGIDSLFVLGSFASAGGSIKCCPWQP